MPRYQNENTDQIVEYDEPDPRLEALDNWHRLDDDPTPKPDAPAPAKAPAKPAPRRTRSRRS